ncbi:MULTISPECIES: hypothetical protein [Clostridia]|uniref:hypothetical protein n=1 Tax=Clostridia TaxID=186801 RepID=UPI001314BC08|nr:MULTISPECIES: hypothetical protein [Clostridia]
MYAKWISGSRNGEVIPEWRFADRQKPEQGAKLFEVVDGREKLVGVFDGKKWISVK